MLSILGLGSCIRSRSEQISKYTFSHFGLPSDVLGSCLSPAFTTAFERQSSSPTVACTVFWGRAAHANPRDILRPSMLPWRVVHALASTMDHMQWFMGFRSDGEGGQISFGRNPGRCAEHQFWITAAMRAALRPAGLVKWLCMQIRQSPYNTCTVIQAFVMVGIIEWITYLSRSEPAID